MSHLTSLLLVALTCITSIRANAQTHLSIRANAQTHLEVLSTTVESDNRTVDITLQNRTEAPIVSFVLAEMFYDANGKAVNPEPSKGGYDYVNNIRTPGQPNIIQPQQTTVVKSGFSIPVASAETKVVAVVHLDRTAEGDPLAISLTFQTRQLHATAFSNAADLVSKYPTSPEAWEPLRAKLAENRYAQGFEHMTTQ